MSFKRRCDSIEGHKQPKLTGNYNRDYNTAIHVPRQFITKKYLGAARAVCEKRGGVSGGTSFHGGLPPQFRIPTPMSQMHSLELPHTF